MTLDNRIPWVTQNGNVVIKSLGIKPQLAFIGIILLLWIPWIKIQYFSRPTEISSISEIVSTDLKLVDTFNVEGSIVEFKLKNSGNDSAFLKEVKFLLQPAKVLLSTCNPAPLTVYDYTLEIEGFGSSLVLSSNQNAQGLKISQVVPPRGVDRFQVRFTVPESPYAVCAPIYTIQGYAVIEYDENKKIRTPVFTIYPNYIR